MIRMLVFFALLLAAATGLAFVLETPGHVVLSYGGFEYKVTLAKAIALVLALTITLMLLWTAIRMIFRLPSLIAMSNRMRRRAKGYTAISRGMVSVGVGDRRAASRFAGEAERLLGREPMTLLLKAQAAQLSGDKQAAEATFTRMLHHNDTKVLGLRGLYIEARRGGDETARAFAEEAFKLAPSAPWAGEAVLEYRCADRNWHGALAVVDESASRRTIDRDTAKRQKAALLTASALDMLDAAPDDAYRLAMDALKLNPGQVTAAVLAAKRLSAKGDYAKASRVLESAWKLIQHPEVAEAYLGVRHGDSSHDRLKRARQLAKFVPSSRETRLTVARAAMDASEFALARQELEALVLDQPTARVCRLMSELEERETGNAGMMRKWLSRASIAPRDPAWVADGFVSDHWAPVSPVTGRIDAFVWMTPPQSLESQVRAAIDADRFAPPVDHPEPAAPAIAAPQPPQEVPASPLPEMPSAVIEVKSYAEAGAVSAPHLPDDPGPRSPMPKSGKKWRLF